MTLPEWLCGPWTKLSDAAFSASFRYLLSYQKGAVGKTKNQCDQETELTATRNDLHSVMKIFADHAIRKSRLDSLAWFPGCLARPGFCLLGKNPTHCRDEEQSLSAGRLCRAAYVPAAFRSGRSSTHPPRIDGASMRPTWSSPPAGVPLRPAPAPPSVPSPASLCTIRTSGAALPRNRPADRTPAPHAPA